MDKRKKKMRNRLIKSLVLVVAFVVAIGTTFGLTMAYFGGTANSGEGKITLKTGIWINASTPTIVTGSQYVVPSQVVEPECVVTIKSSKGKDDAANATASASKALLKATITITDGTGSTNLVSSSLVDCIQVLGGTNGTTHVGNFIKKTGTSEYYFVATTVSTYSASALMQEVDTTAGEVTYKFKLKVSIPSTLGNAAGGTEIKVSVAYQAVQADFYDTNGALIDKTITQADIIFGATTGDATYPTPTPQN